MSTPTLAMPGSPAAPSSPAAPATSPAPIGRHAGGQANDAILAGRYELRERVGRGSAAEVYRAVDLTGGPDAAVKIAVAVEPKHRNVILNEAAVLATLDHPSIIRFIASGTTPERGTHAGRPYLVEELALGENLSRVVSRGRCPEAELAAWAYCLFEALAHLHSHGLVHRDIKPSNLMLSGLRRSPVRIIDFGITARAGASPEPGISSGTVHYMSPEQASGGAAQTSWDIYSMGLVLLELHTGDKAFPGTAVESLVARTFRSPHVPDSLGPEWQSFLRSLTAMDSAERPTAEQAAAMAARLMRR
ncbi:serine/threonine-protein kinase [Pseudarthrobacter sp. NPDC058362]|uniref:serine/threonine-protein kinase n=1 Tax=Pseudarthrobacter sp. NPDC058362 TaxID=3346458 RepID=UPI003668B28F